MKILLLLITAFPLLAYPQTGTAKSPAVNEHVGITFSLKPQSMAPGDSGVILIGFKPEDQYFINTEPPASVKIDSNNLISSVGKIQISKSKKPDYVDTSQPVRVPFKLRNDVKKGAHDISGTLTYFFCSGTDGWCSKFKQPFTLKLTVR